MKLQLLGLIAIGILTGSCSTMKKSKNPKIIEEGLWVSGYKVTKAEDTSPKQYYWVNKNDNPESNTWFLLEQPLKGYYFQEGIMKHLKVKKVALDPEVMPTEQVNFQYESTDILMKQKDNRYAAIGEWNLETINGLKPKDIKSLPTLFMNLAQQSYSGNDGCNSYSGTITHIGQKALSLGHAAATMRACILPDIGAEYYSTLSKVAAYKVEDNMLLLLNDKDQVLITFSKSTKDQLVGFWMLTAMEGIAISAQSPTAKIEIDVHNNKVTGTDACNRFNAALLNLTQEEIQVSDILSTKMACPDNKVAKSFFKLLEASKKYALKNDHLYLYDIKGKELLCFKR